MSIIQSDLHKHKFKWMNLELGLIDELKELLQILAHPSAPEHEGSLLFFLNTETLESIFTLNFIDKITNYPDNNYGKPIYDKTLDFFTALLNFFITFYLKKDFFLLEKIEIEEIDTLTPFARQRIREKNQNNTFILNKYFKEFNLTDFATKIVNKFIIGLSQRWINENQRAHFFSVQISKMLFEYSLLNIDDCERVKNVLYQKIQNLRLLEGIIEQEPNDFPAEQITNDFIKIREYYGEFLLSLAYFKQDQELINFFETVYKKVDVKDTRKKSFFHKFQKNFEEAESFEKYLPFENNFFFEKEYSRKSIEIFGYTLSQQKIRGKSLISKSSETISRNFMYLFSNNNDPYTKSLKLMVDDQYRNYFSMRQNFTPYDSFFENFLYEFKHIIEIDMKKHIFRENIILNDVEDFLLNLMAKVGLKEFSSLKEEMNLDKVNIKMQFQMCENNFGFIIQNLLSIYLEDIKKENKEKLLDIMLFLLQYYLIDNCDNQSIFFQEKIFNKYFDKMINVFPHQTVLFLYNISINFPKIIVTKSYTLEIFLNYHHYLYKTFYLDRQNYKPEGFVTLRRILKIIDLHLKKELLKIFVETPANDIVVAENLLKFKEILSMEEIDSVVINYKSLKNNENTDRYEYLMDFLLFLSDVLQIRYTNKTYESLIKVFNLKNLRELINLDKYNLHLRSIAIELFDTLHVDIKDHLIDDREKYYRDQPKINTYEEDIVINIESYRTIISFIVEEINFFTEEFERYEHDVNDRQFFYDYVHNGILGVLGKLSNFCLTLTDANLYHFIGNYILDNLLHFL